MHRYGTAEMQQDEKPGCSPPPSAPCDDDGCPVPRSGCASHIFPKSKTHLSKIAKHIFPKSVHTQLGEVEENYKRLSPSITDLVKTRYKPALCHEMY